MFTDHPLLADIRHNVLASGSCTCQWGELRREVFPEQPAWNNLRAWAVENGMECEFCASEESRGSEVRFVKVVQVTAG
jgi:hypothetical protein